MERNAPLSGDTSFQPLPRGIMVTTQGKFAGFWQALGPEPPPLPPASCPAILQGKLLHSPTYCRVKSSVMII